MLLSTSSACLHFGLGLAPSVSDGKDRRYSEAEAFSDYRGTLDRGQKELVANCFSLLPFFLLLQLRVMVVCSLNGDSL